MNMQDLLPMSFSPRKVMQGLCFGALAGVLCNCYYFYVYNQMHSDLWYLGVDGVRYLKPDASMPPFLSLLGISLYGCLASVLAMIPVAWLFWHSHFMGSKSIYIMRRLTNPWELPRRCFTIPTLAAICFLMLAIILLLLDFAIYWRCTPSILLPPTMWDAFWN